MNVWLVQTPVRYRTRQPLTFQRTPLQPGKRCVGRGFVNEHQPVRHLAHDRLARVNPTTPFS